MLEIQAIQSCLAPVCFAENEKWKLVHFSFKLAIEHTNPKKRIQCLEKQAEFDYFVPEIAALG
jgi:hypothetical protein